MLLYIFILLCLGGVQRVCCLADSFNQEYIVSKNEFSVVIVNLSNSKLSDEAAPMLPRDESNQELERYSFIVQPYSEADLPSNWNYLVKSGGDAVILYGTMLGEDSQYLDLMILRYDSELYMNSAVLRVRLTSRQSQFLSATKQNPVSHQRDELMSTVYLNLQLGFHKINLEEFLIGKAKTLDSMMRRVLWLGSRLVGVSSESNGNVKVGFVGAANSTGDGEDPFVARLEAEVWRATRNASPQLCKFKESKTISVEHYFRRLDLYPNWCMLKVTRSQAPS